MKKVDAIALSILLIIVAAFIVKPNNKPKVISEPQVIKYTYEKPRVFKTYPPIPEPKSTKKPFIQIKPTNPSLDEVTSLLEDSYEND